MSSQQPPRVVVATARAGQTVRVLDDLVTFTVTGSQTEGAFSLLFDQVLPQGSVPMHTQTGQETFIIFQGQLQFCIQDNGQMSTFTADRGTVIHIPAGVPHSYTNLTTSSASMFVLFTPSGKTERFFKRLGVEVTDPGHVPPFVMPPPETLAAVFEEFQVQLVPPPPQA